MFVCSWNTGHGKKYVKAALGRSDISVHKLRSSFAMEFYKSEKNLLVLQERMGHKSMAATNIYAKASDKKVRCLCVIGTSTI